MTPIANHAKMETGVTAKAATNARQEDIVAVAHHHASHANPGNIAVAAMISAQVAVLVDIRERNLLNVPFVRRESMVVEASHRLVSNALEEVFLVLEL